MPEQTFYNLKPNPKNNVKKSFFILSVIMVMTLGVVSALGSNPAETAWSAPSTLDTVSIASGQSFQLLPTTPISYSTKWAYGYDRKITLLATETGNTISSAGDAHTIYESAGEAEGTYQWNYAATDPSELPRDTSYSISYSISDANTGTSFTPAGGVSSSATITILPEPGILLGVILLGLAAFKRA